jgi:hypothetical protein
MKIAQDSVFSSGNHLCESPSSRDACSVGLTEHGRDDLCQIRTRKTQAMPEASSRLSEIEDG